MMPIFFVPDATSSEAAEQIYRLLQKASGQPIDDRSRLLRVSFTDHGRVCVAEVGRNISNWRERSGIVLAIIEIANLVLIHTEQRKGSASNSIMVGADEIVERAYFDDFPKR